MTQSVLFSTPDSDITPVTEDAVTELPELNKSDKGDVSELAFELEARRRGWIVCTPRGNTKGFDCVVLRPGVAPVLVQVKAGTWLPEKLIYQFNNNQSGQIYSDTAYDIMAVHLVRENQWVFFSRSEVGNRMYGRYAVMNSDNFAPRKYPSLYNVPPDNWERIDEVAFTKTNSGPIPADVRPPTVHLTTSL